ncbi:hypothetical protein HJC99_06785 [Candidatus Saccharibacteria bacterium]|nr:hypothetical protein [Candidatus Saccharibacteria bacterium]
MKSFSRLYVKSAAALVVGFFFAGAVTSITYACTPVDGAAGCVSFDKAVLHLGDLADNKQSSLVHFATTFAVVSLITFVILSILSFAQKRKSRVVVAK